MLGFFFVFAFFRLIAGTSCVVDPKDPYPSECDSAHEGSKCLESKQCGCIEHDDCFTNPVYPYCNPQTNQCQACTAAESNPNSSFKDHFFCATRYPGYATHPGTGVSLTGERVAPSGYYREYCVRGNEGAGACHRCNQAPLQPRYNFSDIESNEAASGTFFCNTIKPNTPICMDQTYMKDADALDTFDVNVRGKCVPCTKNAHCARALPDTPICNVSKTPKGDANCIKCSDNAECDAGAGGPNCFATGACKACTSDGDCEGDGGAHIGDSCNTKTGICFTKCSANSDCVGADGSNCQKDGTCSSCKEDKDCGEDGGEKPDQPLCNATTGVCESLCKSNNDCVGRNGANCQANGRCHSCKSDDDCGALDGGSNPGQTECDLRTGICKDKFQCKTNGDCKGQGGNNCQADGSCISCVDADQCGELDGGGTPGQPNCRISKGVCTDACERNSDCKDTQGENCMADGVCESCESHSDCGALDGGNQPNQPTCNTTTHLCTFCETNSDCPTDQATCGNKGLCFNCSQPGQTCLTAAGHGLDHCEPDTGLCVTYCTEDAHCEDQCLPHCNLDRGCCVECNTNADCPLAHWRKAAKRDFTTCSLQSFTCIKGCSIDDDCTDPKKPACSSRGECVACVANSHCTTKEAQVCSASEEKCVECLTSVHCKDEAKPYCSEEQLCSEEPSGGLLEIVALVIAIIALVFVLSWFAYFVYLRRNSKDDTQQLLRTSTY